MHQQTSDNVQSNPAPQRGQVSRREMGDTDGMRALYNAGARRENEKPSPRKSGLPDLRTSKSKSGLPDLRMSKSGRGSSPLDASVRMAFRCRGPTARNSAGR